MWFLHRAGLLCAAVAVLADSTITVSYVGAPTATSAPVATRLGFDNGTVIAIPVAPLPETTALIDRVPYQLSASWDVAAPPRERVYHWTVEAVTGDPDGYKRRIFTVNKQFPGPLIEANSHDNITIHLHNKLESPVTIHYHGLYQNGSQIMDGTVGFSQCPIQPDAKYTYHFNLRGQYGTYFWHAHYANLIADGLVGPIVIHSPSDPLVHGRDYDDDRVILASDWLDITSEAWLAGTYEFWGKSGEAGQVPGPVPFGDAFLINGRGQSICDPTNVPEESLKNCNPNATLTEIPVRVGKSTRLRFINAGALDYLRIALDNHTLEVVEIDGTPVWGPQLQHVPLHAGQRTSVIVNATQGKAGDAFWLRVNGVADVGGESDFAGMAAVRYTTHWSNTKTITGPLPTSTAWDDGDLDLAEPFDIDERYDVKPRVAIDAPTDVQSFNAIYSGIGVLSTINGPPTAAWGVNNITWQAQPYYPLLEQVMDGRQLDGNSVPHVTIDQGAYAGDIIVNNLDFDPDPVEGYVVTHPFHLHGRPFFIVGRGAGVINSTEDLANISLNTTNPLRRDTIGVKGGDWALLRLIADVPGVWALHCHIGLHLSLGKMAAVIVHPESVQQFSKPDDWSQLCAGQSRQVIDRLID